MVEKRYQTLAEVPGFARKCVEKLIKEGKFVDANELDLSYDMVRILYLKDE